MMKSAVTICLVEQARLGPFVFHDELRDGFAKAAKLGFDAVEIFPPAASAVDIAELQGLLDHHGLKLAAVGTGAGWLLHGWSLTHPDATVRGHARDFIRAVVDFAGGFGAPAIVGSMQGRVEKDVAREQALGWLAEGLGDLSEEAAAHGVPLLYEPLNRYETNLFTRVGDAAAWLKDEGIGNVRLLCDLFHMNIEEADLAATLRSVGPMIGHVHFADSNRWAVGFGHTNLEPVIAALREVEYAGYLSAEILPLPDPETAARQTMQSFRHWVE